MYKIFLSILILILTISCSKPVNYMQVQSIDINLSQYLLEFENQALKRGVRLDTSHLVMSFNETMPYSSIPGGTVVAYCQISPQGPSVIVKGSVFYSVSVSDREQIVFHELGHCLLGLQHDNTTEIAFDWFGSTAYMQNVPSSIMNETHFSSSLYDPNRSTYLDRLFRVSNSNKLFYNGPSQFDPTIYF